MEPDDATLIRRGYDLFNGGRLEESLELFDESVHFRTSGMWPGISDSYEGRDGMLQFFRALLEPWESFQLEPHRFLEADDGTLVLLRFVGRGRDGIEVEARFGHLFTIRDGRIVALRAINGWDEALAAARLEAGH